MTHLRKMMLEELQRRNYAQCRAFLAYRHGSDHIAVPATPTVAAPLS